MPASINNNLMAANVANIINSHYGKLATSAERLSSGLRVNSAADDAAGLAIRELMRSDVAALNQGMRNANDAISMIQVADGALGIIDEKLIRMKELAEQAATGTYDSTQRLMIHSEFVAMGEEIDRIARATDFNGIKLLDGSLQGEHDGSGLNSTGKLKVHFGTTNDSAEDYYYVEIGDCTLAGLGLRDSEETGISNHSHTVTTQEIIQSGDGVRNINKTPQVTRANNSHEGSIWESGIELPPLNDAPPYTESPDVVRPYGRLETLDNLFAGRDKWAQSAETTRRGTTRRQDENFMFLIPAGSKNVLINMLSCENPISPERIITGDNDIQLFTKTGIHLAGTPLNDFVHAFSYRCDIDYNSNVFGFDSTQYDGSLLNSGPSQFDYGATLNYSTYNGMTIGYSGDADQHDILPNDGKPSIYDYETLTIDVVTEDLIVWFPGAAGIQLKAYNNLPDLQNIPDPPDPPFPPDFPPDSPPDAPDVPPNSDSFTHGSIISIKTQEKAQQALKRIDDAIVAKDKVRANLGATQNRLENTVTNLTIMAENLLSAESRISDADIGAEMMIFVRNQILTQSAIAMLGQANSYPHMLSGLITG